jgi:hypothetical protein
MAIALPRIKKPGAIVMIIGLDLASREPVLAHEKHDIEFGLVWLKDYCRKLIIRYSNTTKKLRGVMMRYLINNTDAVPPRVKSLGLRMASSLLIFSMILTACNFALAKSKSRARAFSYFEDGGIPSQGECDPERKIPRRLKRNKEFIKSQGYLGSELIETTEENGTKVDSLKHYFSSSSVCNSSLNKRMKSK